MPAIHSLHELSPAECQGLLRTARVGRVGVSVDALQAIFPVFVTMVGDSVVFRTAPGTKLHAAGDGAIVAVEIDEIDETTGEGWSVLVRGIARELDDGPEIEAARAQLESTLLDGGNEHLVAVNTDLVTGRHMRLGEPSA